MYTLYDSKSRRCAACGNERIPDIKRVKKGRKYWIIFTCKICKMKDIETYIPMQVWNGERFVDEDISEEDTKDSGE